jgi:hypothetical protein
VEDLDIVIEASMENAQRFLAVYDRLVPVPRPAGLTVEKLLKPKTKIPVPYYGIEALTSIDAVPFGELYRDSIVIESQGVEIRMISREHLLRSKKDTGRPKDQEDYKSMVEHRLFSKVDINAVLEHQKDLFNQALQKLPAETIRQMSKEFGEGSEPTLRAFVDEHWLHIPVIDDAKIEGVEDEEAQVDGRGNPNRIIFDYDRPFYVPGRSVTLAAPFEGDAGFFDIRPNTYTSSVPGAEIVDKEVRMTYEVESPVDYAAIKQNFIRTLGEITQYLRWLSESVSHFNGELTGIARRYILERKTILDRDAAGMEKLGIPKRKKEADVATSPVRDKVFFSYSHKDRKWLEKFQTMLKPLERNEKIVVWNDKQIRAGDRWKEEIQKALSSAKVAVLLVSPHFLDSDFIAEHELPPLLNAAKEAGLTILWVSVSHCLHTETEIAEYQAANDPARPLDSLSTSEQNRVIAEICKQIEAAANH